jgi:hypothetical protein
MCVYPNDTHTHTTQIYTLACIIAQFPIIYFLICATIEKLFQFNINIVLKSDRGIRFLSERKT